MTNDRTVHATTGDGTEIVRYDRAGKWYLEQKDGTRRQVSVKEAAELVISDRSSRWFRGRMGGSRFDGLIIQRRSSHTAERR